MTNNRTMAEMLRAPTKGCAEAIVVPLILAEQFKLKHSLINMMSSEQFFGLEKDNPHDHVRWLRLLRKSVLPAEVLIRTTSVLPPVATLSQNTGITSKMNTASTSGSGTLPGNTIANPKGKLKAITTRSGLVTDGPTVPNPPKSVNLEEDECVEETYTDPDLVEYTIKVPPPPLEKLLELANTLLNENCSAVILKKLPKKLGDPGKFLIPCGFSELKCKALADLGASINLMPLSVWKKLGLPDLIPTRMTLELANSAICTPDGIARDVFVPVGKFTFSADFVVVDYESDPRVPLILGRPFLRTDRALIDVHGEEMILRDGDERLTLNMKHDTASYSNHPHRESVDLINIFNISNIDSFNDIHPHFDDDPLSGSTTYSANSLLEEFADELALISYPSDYDDNHACDIESDIREIEFLLYQGEDSDFKDSIDQSDLAHCDDLFVDLTPEMFTNEQPPDYSFPSRFDVYSDDFLEIESDDAKFDNDSLDSKGEKIKEAELLIDQLDLPCDILSEYDSFNSQNFSKDDDLPSPNNEDKDLDPPIYKLLVFKEVSNLMRLLSFSFENEEKVFKPGICTSKKQKFDESFHEAWERYKDLLHACPHHGFTELHQLDTFYNALNPADQDSLNAAAGGNLLEKSPQDALTIIKNKLKVKAVEEICVTCGGAHPYYQCPATGGNTFPEYRDNIQSYVSAAARNFNQGNPGYSPQGFNRGLNFNQEQPYQATQSNQNFHLNELEKIKRMNDVSLKATQNQIDMVKNELRNEMKTSIQTSLSNQINEIKNIMASLLQMNTASTSGSGTLPSNTIANPKGELKAITTRSGIVTDGPTIPNPSNSVNPEDECVEEMYTDPDHTEYTIKVPSPLPVQNLSLRFKEILFSILGTLFHRLSRFSSHAKIPKMLKALLYNKEKLQELANTPLNENCSAVILKKLPEKLGDPGKFLIPCGFSELKCKALADLRASINLMPLSVWKKLGLPDLITTRMTLELANRAICTPDGIARDVFIPVGKFTFPIDFVVVDYESDPRVPLILGRPFLRTVRALIDVHDEEMILRDGDERLTLNMKHDTASYSNHPQRESVNLINIFNIPIEDCLEDLVSHKQSGNPTFSLHKEIASPKVIHEFYDSKGCNFLSEEFLDIDSFNDIHPYFDDDPLSGSTTYSANSLLEEIANELALITYPSDYDDNHSIDQSDLANLDNLFVDPTHEMFTDEQPPDYSFPPRFDVYPDDFLEIESDADNFDDDLFDSKVEKIKEAELLIAQLDLLCDILSEYDSFNSQDFSRDDDFPSLDNEDKVFNPGILIHEKSVKIITRVAQGKKLAVSYASWLFEDFDPSFYELLVFKEVLNSMRLLLFSSENEEKVFKPGIYTFKKPDDDFSCSKWKEYSSFGCSSVTFLSPLIHSSMGEFGPAHLTLNKRFVGEIRLESVFLKMIDDAFV
nr:hypothetical protein [Tanacetum cinerariifolium]